MANTIGNPGDASVGNTGGLKTTPENYTSLATLIDPTKPDVRDLYVQTYGDQGITGFLELTGAKKNAGTSDEVEWYEEGRLHKTVAYTGSAAKADANTFATLTLNPAKVRLNDVLLLADGSRVIVVKKGSTTVDVVDMDGGDVTASMTGTAAIVGNVYGQGTNQPSEFYQTGLVKRRNPYIITKEMYEVNGSQATNIGWLNVNGQYLWYLKNEMDARKRFMNQREMMLLYSQLGPDATPALVDIETLGTSSSDVTGKVGSEGYFSAVEKRGITAQVSGGAQGSFASMSDIDQIILELDKEGAPAEYAMYVNRATSLDIDDMLANGIATQVTAGLAGQFGAFNNDADMAVKLGFKSFTRGGYTFHKHDWKLLNDPTLVGASNKFQGVMCPLTTVADAKTGIKAPALEMKYKASNGYSREMEHWVTGGGVMGHTNNGDAGKDVATFHYRSEACLLTRAANQHVLIKG